MAKLVCVFLLNTLNISMIYLSVSVKINHSTLYNTGQSNVAKVILHKLQ